LGALHPLIATKSDETVALFLSFSLFAFDSE